MKPLFQIKALSKSYGARVLFDDATMAIPEKGKIGLVGRNGAGKSTLLRILIGEEHPDAGEIVASEMLRLAYLSQSDPFEESETVQSFLERVSGKPEWECARIAARFEITPELFGASVRTLSGGFQMRVRLSAMLLSDPNFLLLDEPTNYLDLNTLLLLEKFLQSYNGGFMIVSHDREFLKNTCEQTLEVEHGRLFLFPGDVESYLEFKEDRRSEQIRQNRNIEARRKELAGFVERFRAKASKASQARSKQKQLERLHTIEIDHPLRNVRIRIPSPQSRKGLALRTEGLAIGYDGLTVAAGISLQIRSGARMAVLGQNGQGKSTLLKTLAGRLEPRAGSFRWGKGSVAYYAQHVYGEIPEDRTIVTYLTMAAARDVTRQEILDMAGSFLFQGDDVEKPVRVLSGGERARLCLAGLLLGKSEILLLDEPTNHLDFETVEALGFALRDFTGTLFVVSHDRTFVKLIATEIIEIDRGEVSVYPGDYDGYVYRLQSGAGSTTNARPIEASSARESPTASPVSGGLNDYQMRKRDRSDLALKNREARESEERVRHLEAERDRLLKELADDPGSYVPERDERLTTIARELEDCEARWLTLQGEIEELRTRT
ncbi:MAG: ABC-F family ATP-binding cassette domain-containing protein [Spirochaetales bacterium]|nr:ABC-F family ATP-binding cassette domain-containing protein [Leptospiraceae bacterium]MCP5481580.1 ABC-F family ATP-binding cassette domain-containing protein [Spirochaetales bacterium]MCP5484408.1 ABC-F family ATP-binding cassette domain-containing protein [Spirochaetales bacterium]